MFGIPVWFGVTVSGVFFAIFAYLFLVDCVFTTHIDVPESDVPLFVAIASTPEEIEEYRTLALRNRETFWCTPGTRRSATCPFNNYDARNDYKCGWCCLPRRDRKGLPTK